MLCATRARTLILMRGRVFPERKKEKEANPETNFSLSLSRATLSNARGKIKFSRFKSAHALCTPTLLSARAFLAITTVYTRVN